MKQRSTTDFLCQRINESFKSKINRSVVTYKSECWLTIKDNAWRLVIIEMKMLRGASSVTCHDHIRNEDIPDRYGVQPIVEKL